MHEVIKDFILVKLSVSIGSINCNDLSINRNMEIIHNFVLESIERESNIISKLESFRWNKTYYASFRTQSSLFCHKNSFLVSDVDG